jgi:Cof subfamily protein (haloacid dehalogenase superfamily)|tara:strand:- start:394 stop:1227 length:834 start_codon:yes stop_codon:yes gene_type:complete
MIALDLDGTLAVENHQVLPATRDALKDLHFNGVEVVIATGRRYRTTRLVIESLGFDVYAVCNGGALVKEPEQSTLHAESYDVRPVAELARELGLTLFAQRDAHELGGADFIVDTGSNWNDATNAHFNNNSEWAEKADLLASEPAYLVSGAFDSESSLNELVRQTAIRFPDVYNTILVPHLDSGHFYCEISPKHIDKWHGLTKLNEHLGIAAEHTCTVGDQLNDMAMVKASGHGVAMGNGHEDLQKVARLICGDNKEDGILDVVNYIHDINKTRPQTS